MFLNNLCQNGAVFFGFEPNWFEQELPNIMKGCLKHINFAGCSSAQLERCCCLVMHLFVLRYG